VDFGKLEGFWWVEGVLVSMEDFGELKDFS